MQREVVNDPDENQFIETIISEGSVPRTIGEYPFSSPIQQLDTPPQVNFAIDQIVGEGGNATVTVYLNGLAPDYPIGIPFIVSNNTTDPGDHDASSGTILITSGISGSYSFNVSGSDLSGENDETLTFIMGIPSNATAGVNTTHTVTITEANLAPTLFLLATQQVTLGGVNRVTRLIDNQLGSVSISALVQDPNPGSSHSYDWSGTDNSLVALGGNVPSIFTFDSSTLMPGLYTVRVSVTDDGVPPAISSNSLTLLIYDGTQISFTIAAPLLFQSTGFTFQSTTGLVQTKPGLNLSPGHYTLTYYAALKSFPAQPAIIRDWLQSDEDDPLTEEVQNLANLSMNYNLLNDFEISGLANAGQSIELVIPLSEPLNTPQEHEDVYRVLSVDGFWVDFTIDNKNSIASAQKSGADCPSPGSTSYQPGLNEGSDCVQLTLEDGGPNDGDGEANGAITTFGSALPKVLALVASGSSTSEISGGSGSLSPFLLLLFAALYARVWRTRTTKFQRKQ